MKGVIRTKKGRRGLSSPHQRPCVYTSTSVSGSAISIGDLAPGQSRISSVVTVSFRQGEHGARLVPFEPVFLSSGSAYWSDTTEALVTDVRLARDAGIPMDYRLEQNYPNPFNPSTTIRYGLPQRSQVSLTVYNTLGQQVVILQNGEKAAGYHEVKFEGSGLSSGVYFCSLASNRTNVLIVSNALVLRGAVQIFWAIRCRPYACIRVGTEKMSWPYVAWP